MMPQESVRSARIEARIAPEALAIVKRAAEIQGRSVSEFVVSAAQEAASKTIEETTIIRLSAEGFFYSKVRKATRLEAAVQA